MKRKKYQESLIDQIFACLDKVEMIISDIEMAQLNTEIIAKMKEGNEALKELNQVIFFICYVIKSKTTEIRYRGS